MTDDLGGKMDSLWPPLFESPNDIASPDPDPVFQPQDATVYNPPVEPVHTPPEPPGIDPRGHSHQVCFGSSAQRPNDSYQVLPAVYMNQEEMLHASREGIKAEVMVFREGEWHSMPLDTYVQSREFEK